MQISGTNFQSWATFSLEVEGLTCIVGPSNLGKSAIFRSVVAITRNSLPEGWIREGTKKVTLSLTDGPVEINMYRSDKTSPVYTIGDKEYSKLNGKVPDEIEALGLNPVKVGNFTFDPIFASQFDPQFGLSWGPSDLNAVLGAFASTEKLEKGKKEVNKRILQANQEAEMLAKEVAGMNGQLLLALALAEKASQIQNSLDLVQQHIDDCEVKGRVVLELGHARRSLSEVQDALGDLGPQWEPLSDLRTILDRVIYLEEFIPSLKALAGLQKALDRIPELDTKVLPEARILELIPVLLQPARDLKPMTLDMEDFEDTQGLLHKTRLVNRIMDTLPSSPVQLQPVPMVDTLAFTRKLDILQQIVAEAGIIEDLHDDLDANNISLQSMEKERQGILEELGEVDVITCPNCNHKWRETE